jgi:hypothetical protein
MFGWLESSGLAQALQASGWLFPAINTVHVLALALVYGTIAMVDLRILRLAFRREPLARFTAALLPWAWTAFVAAAASGALMFIAGAERYAVNPAFQLKMALLLAAGLNMLAYRLLRPQRNEASRSARASAALSLFLWTGIIASGRWIGFL